MTPAQRARMIGNKLAVGRKNGKPAGWHHTEGAKTKMREAHARRRSIPTAEEAV